MTDARPTLGTLPGSAEEQGANPRAVGADPFARGAVLSGRYRLGEVLGAGGMGRVVEGTHVALGSRLAIKFLHEWLASDRELVRRFEREAKALVALDHPNVVRVIDLGHEAGRPYIVMEFLAGRTLGQILDDLEPALPPVEDVVTMLAGVCDGLAAAHDRGLVHRDLKPDNIIVVERTPGPPLVKILDFGLVHLDEPDAASTLTRVDDVAGTPNYMSPEQCRSLRVGPRSDLYAMGCVLHTALTGSAPFADRSAMDIVAKQMYAPIPLLVRPADAPPVPRALDALRVELLAKDPGARPATAREVAERLRASLAPASVRGAARGAHPPRGEVRGAVAGDATPSIVARLLRVADAAGAPAVDDATLVALGALGVRLVPAASLADVLPADGLLLVDAGASADAAIPVLRALGDFSRRAAVVCVAGLDAAGLNRLVEAGAADALRMPSGAELVARRLARLDRRLRHEPGKPPHV